MSVESQRVPANVRRDVPEIMRSVANDVVLPRFRQLRDSDIELKSPGEIVTIADREAEMRLSACLVGCLPGSRVVGEERASAEPSLLDHLDAGDVWLVDPLDGTANFVAGDPQFAIIVALLRRGHPTAAWILDPVRDLLVSAVLGEGAFIGETDLRSSAGIPALNDLDGIVKTRFLPDDIRTQIDVRSNGIGTRFAGPGCAGHEYPGVAQGQPHFVLYWRTLPWDHAAGVLFLTEAGGCARRLDGSSYSPIDQTSGLLIACNAAVWSMTHEVLFGSGDKLHG